jgi:hypothetical protein
MSVYTHSKMSDYFNKLSAYADIDCKISTYNCILLEQISSEKTKKIKHVVIYLFHG